MLSAPIKITLFILGLVVSSFLQAENIDFARDIQPIFAEHCTTCHGPDEQKGGLNLTEEESLHGKLKSGKPNVSHAAAFSAGGRPPRGLGGDSRQRSEFADFAPLTPRKSRFFMKFRHLTRATGAPMQALSLLELFLCPMDRAETLHAQSYDLDGSRKNTPGQNELVAEEQS